MAQLRGHNIDDQYREDRPQSSSLQSKAKRQYHQKNNNRGKQIQPRQDWLCIQLHRLIFPAVSSFLCKKMDKKKNRKVIHTGRDRCRFTNFQIGDSKQLRHDKGSVAHNRRHDLSSGRCAGLDCSGFLRRIADLLHHWDCDNAGARYICCCRAGNHSHQAAGNNSRFCRTGVVLRFCTELHAEVNQHITAAECSKQRAENHYPIKEARAGARRLTIDAGVAHDQKVNHFFKAHTLVVQNPWQPFADKGVYKKYAAENGQSLADRTQNQTNNHNKKKDTFQFIYKQNRI